jgi:hypothetical protein
MTTRPVEVVEVDVAAAPSPACSTATEGDGAMNNAAGAMRKVALTTWEGIWHVPGCIALGGAYFQKIPAKRAMADFGLCELTGAEHFWYVLQCVMFGWGYFAKIPVAKALSELPQYRSDRQAGLVTLS